MQYAIDHFKKLASENKEQADFDYVVILDADNVVEPHFLEQLNHALSD